jgi:hypothetical protein
VEKKRSKAEITFSFWKWKVKDENFVSTHNIEWVLSNSMLFRDLDLFAFVVFKMLIEILAHFDFVP